MGPELWIILAAAFVGGGAIGSGGTLFAQWLFKQIETREPPVRTLASAEVDLLRADIQDMTRHVHNLDARLDFQERLIGGSLTPPAPPGRLGPREDEPARGPDGTT
jgi:hypothetical protein